MSKILYIEEPVMPHREKRAWIMVVHLAFVLSAVLGSVAKIGMYHGRLPQW